MKLANMNTQIKIALGSVLSTFGVLSIILSLLLGWSEAPRPWGFLLGFGAGVITGLGATLVIAGFIEHRHGN